MMIPQNILTIFLKHKVEARFVFSNLQQLLLKRLYSWTMFQDQPLGSSFGQFPVNIYRKT